MIDIAVGDSRKTVKWHNKRMSWDAIINRISKAQETHETYAQYMSMAKERQDEIKDVGGFVGGFLNEGHRGKGHVKHRQLVTLDIDYLPANYDIWDDFLMFFDCAALIYSTHKHSTKTPRYRIVIPLDKPVTPEQYEAISRKIASMLGIQYFDATTFQEYRLMYWPSYSKGAEYVFKVQDGEPLNHRSILRKYTDWSDISSWPVCPGESKSMRTQLKNQEDPTQKRGQIGAFCRTYSISEAIAEFLSDVYEPTDDENRYTFVDGSTGKGAIVYDDLWLYSWHNTDPAGNILCNAFDLVRIHKFGHLDKDPEATVTKLESYHKMMGLANMDRGVIKELNEFAGLGSDDWLVDLDRDGKANLEPTINNLYMILENDPELKGKFAYNQFDYQEYVTGDVPWDPDNTETRGFTDVDDAGLRHYLEKTYKIFQVNKTTDAVNLTIRKNRFHPVKTYLNSLTWDGTSRIENILIDHYGAADSEYTKAVTRNWLTAAVARIYNPGVKFEYVLTLIGAQGIGKSTFFSELGKSWFSDSMGNIHTKEAYEQLQGVWILEMGELAGLKKAEVETIKLFVAKRIDRYRVAYGKRAANFARQTVFGASTNDGTPLRDKTGGRRFWLVTCNEKYIHGTMDIDQIWAEAKSLYESGIPLHLPEHLEEEARIIQLAHTEIDEREGLVIRFLDTYITENWNQMSISQRISHISAAEYFEGEGTIQRKTVCVAEIWCEALKCELRDMTTFNTKALHTFMQNLEGWERVKTIQHPIYGYQRTYGRKEVDEKAERIAAWKREFA